jgi:hypothetical protein
MRPYRFKATYLLPPLKAVGGSPNVSLFNCLSVASCLRRSRVKRERALARWEPKASRSQIERKLI